jgi:hypothetical protein
MLSRSSDIGIWHDSLELGSAAAAKFNMVSSVDPDGGVPSLASRAGSTGTCEVAQVGSPPQSGSIPGTPLFAVPRTHQ